MASPRKSEDSLTLAIFPNTLSLATHALNNMPLGSWAVRRAKPLEAPDQYKLSSIGKDLKPICPKGFKTEAELVAYLDQHRKLYDPAKAIACVDAEEAIIIKYTQVLSDQRVQQVLDFLNEMTGSKQWYSAQLGQESSICIDNPAYIPPLLDSDHYFEMKSTMTELSFDLNKLKPYQLAVEEAYAIAHQAEAKLESIRLDDSIYSNSPTDLALHDFEMTDPHKVQVELHYFNQESILKIHAILDQLKAQHEQPGLPLQHYKKT